MLRTSLQTIRPSTILHSIRFQTQRSFLNVSGLGTQSLTATRILPYNSSSLYTIIADVNSYSFFLPYCLDSNVTKWSEPDTNGKRWPSEADLRVGWGGYEEVFTSRLFCVPGMVVEALGGEATTALSKDDLQHHSGTLNTPGSANSIFQSLITRWTVKPFHYKPPSGRPQTDKTEHPARDQTEVHLSIDFQFSNPVYAALSKAVAPQVAGVMIEAFEIRARKLLDGPGAGMKEESAIKNISSAGQKLGS